MAILKGKGDGFKGRTGSSVVYELNGQIVRRMVGTVTASPTELQLEVRQRTSLIAALLRPVKDFVRVGFKLETKNTTMNPHNLATSINRNQAIKGVYPDLEIDYSRVCLSRGRLPVSDHVKVTVMEYGMQFSWNPDLFFPGMKSTDQILLTAYCPEKRSAFSHLDGARRKDGFEQLSLPRYKETVLFHVYVAFIASNRESLSDSWYAGSLLW